MKNKGDGKKMLSISFFFPAGKYHANTWGKHVNEADVEWPPSQFRILRAIVAVWLKTGVYTAEEISEIIVEMKEAPVYSIPYASITHKRHYMPRNKENPTLIFDAFLAFEPDAELIVSFPNAKLDDRQIKILDDLLRNMNYLGRSESWICAKVIGERDILPNAYPLKEGDFSNLNENEDCIKLLCLDMECMSAAELIKKDGKGNFTHSLFSSSEILKKEKKIYPPNTSSINYAVPADRFNVRYRSNITTCSTEPIYYAKYLIDSPVLPNKKDTVDIADKMRSGLLKIHNTPSKIFAGKDVDGTPLEGNEHAYYFPYDNDGDGKLERIVVYSTKGFDRSHQESLLKIRKLYGYPLKRELNLMLLGMGSFDGAQGNSEIMGSSKVWRSATPFLLTRHPKKYETISRKGEWKIETIQDIKIGIPDDLGYYSNRDHLLYDYGVSPDDCSVILKDGPVSQLLRGLQQLGIEKPISITPIPSNRDSRWLDFKRYRRGKSNPAISVPYGFELVFNNTVKGPIAVGYGAHQGLGMFVAID